MLVAKTLDKMMARNSLQVVGVDGAHSSLTTAAISKSGETSFFLWMKILMFIKTRQRI
jgi:hypothetical protein